MKLVTTAASLALLHLTSRTVSAFIPRLSTTTRLASSIANNMSASDSTVIQPDVSSFMNSERPADTNDYIMQQTMIRVKDPVKSLDFYCNVLGFKLIHYSEFPQWKFNVYFVAPVEASKPTRQERWNHCMNTPGCIELTWNYGTENEEGMVYNTGNADTTGTADGNKVRGGFGHIGITVPNVYTACQRFHSLGVPFHKSPNSGGMKGLAFIKDPDGYLIEVLPQGEMIVEDVDCLGVASQGGEGYKDNSK
eukprot:CCRYP_014916-RA/>CCRYP_014916-RA protein AED:0.12 eAED:0.12 QI:288/1/1/1/1/1/4/379/249